MFLKKELCPSALVPKAIKPANGLISAKDIPKLAHNLDRVLFNPGVHYLRDPRTGHYNFDPFLHHLVQPADFDFGLLPPFVPASQDEQLHKLAADLRLPFISSTSAISGSMGTIYHFLNKSRPLQLDHLSMAFREEPKNFTALSRAPVGAIIRKHPKHPTVRSIMADKASEEQPNVLSKMGHSMERLLTEDAKSYSRYIRKPGAPLSQPSTTIRDAYHYAQAGKILLRSQLDCLDERLPRKTFDLKTRASLPVRMDVYNYQKYLDYKVTLPHGLYESYEREFYDMCRSTMLKYNFQVRIGDMDGIFVAYHNTAEIFGFQYITREQMDACLYGSSNAGDAAFSLILQTYNSLLDLAIDHFPAEDTIKLTLALSKDVSNKLLVYISDGEEKVIHGYALTSVISNRGIRQDHLDISPKQTLSDVKVNLGIVSIPKVNIVEYNATRHKIMKVRGILDDRMPDINDKIMRMIMDRNQPQSNVYF